jgi:hypothetical protein
MSDNEVIPFPSSARGPIQDFNRYIQAQQGESDAALVGNTGSMLQLPFSDRKRAVVDYLRANPQIPSEALQHYVSLPETAVIASEYVDEHSKDRGPRDTLLWWAYQFGAPQDFIDGLRYRELEQAFTVMQECAGEIEPADVEIKASATRMKLASENLDAEFQDWIEQYRQAHNNPIWEPRAELWDGSHDAERAEVEEQREALKKHMDGLKALINKRRQEPASSKTKS